MKQFQYKSATGNRLTHGPFTAKEVSERFPLSVSGVSELVVGESFTDRDNDVWTRLPDLVLQDDAPLTAEDVAVCHSAARFVHDKKRLERFALAYLAVIGPAIVSREVEAAPGETLASIVVKNARELIAELDKPEGNPFEAGL